MDKFTLITFYDLSESVVAKESMKEVSDKLEINYKRVLGQTFIDEESGAVVITQPLIELKESMYMNIDGDVIELEGSEADDDGSGSAV